jgi:hypothetical protein
MTGRCTSACVALVGFLIPAEPSRGQDNVSPITIGAGLQTSFAHTDTNGSNSTNQFQLNHARIYISGPVTDGITFMFNADYDSVTNKVGVLDAVAEIVISPKFNIWAGRFLPPSDRANFYGPFYSNDWAAYNDGIQGGYISAFQGRDNGIAYWGDFNKVKVSLGGFDGGSAGTGKSQMIGAARVQVDFWDKEDGYYLNGTYYGDKNLLAIGGASQIQDGRTASTIDFLLEKKVLNGGAFSIESEYSNYNRLGGYIGGYKSQGIYGLASFLFPKVITIGKLSGKFEILGKYAKADFTKGPTAGFDQRTTEVNLNYVMKHFNARLMMFCLDKRFNALQPDTWQAGIGLQVQR